MSAVKAGIYGRECGCSVRLQLTLRVGGKIVVLELDTVRFHLLLGIFLFSDGY